MDNLYQTIAFFVGIIAFVVIWIYAIVSWGFLLGIAIGWFPAIIGALLIGGLWGLIVIIILGLILYMI